MKQIKYRRITTLVAVASISIGLFVISVSADSWMLPKKTKYYSPNEKYYLEVTPKKLESQLSYFKDKVDDKENAGALKGVPDNRAKASFYVRHYYGGYARRKVFPLVNEVSPVSAVVSNKGDYIVTFDNWHSVGYGDDVVVIYRANGTLIRNFGLEDLLTEGDIETFRRSVSSRSWGGEHYLDESRGHLVLKVVSNGRSPWEQGAEFHDLRIDLATAQPLERKRELFLHFQIVGRVSAGIASEPPASSIGKPSCLSPEEPFEPAEVVRISSEQFYASARDRTLPPYPPIAKAANAEGTVVVEMVVSEAGSVLCARSLSGHPLFRAVAVAAALKWRFEPFEVSGKAVKSVGTVSMSFKLSGKDVNP